MTPAELRNRSAGAVPSHAPQLRVPAQGPEWDAVLRRRARSRVRRVLASPVLRPALDVLALVAAVVLALRWPDEPVSPAHGWPLLLTPLLVVAVLATRGLYERRLRATAFDTLVPTVGSISLGAMSVGLLEVYVARWDAAAPAIGHLWAAAALGVVLVRSAVLVVERLARARGLDGRPTLIVGAGLVGTRLARRLLEQRRYGLEPVGFLDADPLGEASDGGVPVLGSPDDLDWVAQLTGAEHVVIAFSAESDERLVDLVQRCQALGLHVSLVPRLFESLNDRATYEPLGGTPLLGLRSIHPKGWQFAVKHAFDRLASALLLVLLAPLLAVIAVAVKATSRGPVLFRQRRVGRDGTVFDLYKFRSMAMAPRAGTASFTPRRRTAPGGVEGADRRTAVGRLLRRTSLDELPQLFNVLRGEMSLVGPRPERPEFVEAFETDIRRYGARHRVKSGVTGWAQVHGLRGQTSLADRVEWDNYYIEHWTLGLDLKILLLTVVAVLRGAE